MGGKMKLFIFFVMNLIIVEQIYLDFFLEYIYVYYINNLIYFQLI